MGEYTKSADLHYQDGGSSDKVYHLAIEKSDDGYRVVFAYGRRNSTLSYGTKTSGPVTPEKAEAIYAKLLNEKLSKNYKYAPGVSGRIFGSPDGASSGSSMAILEKTSSGVLPQLMNPCTEEEASTLLEDPLWGCQEKLDGRRILIRSNGDVVEGINRKGFIVTVAPAIVEAVSRLGVSVIVDGEGIGDRLYTFGMLEMDGNDMRGLPYIEMYRELERLLDGRPTSALPLVELTTTASEKRNLLYRLRAENREGIVFKHLASAYAPNKPASGGSHLKLKFYATCSVIVTAINDRRSVQVAVVPLNASNGETIPVGNVTIPVNKDIPDVGAVAELRYLYAFKGGSLFQPQYLGTRDDILPKECSETQLKFKSTMDVDG